MLRDTQLLSIICVLLAVDCCVIGLWFVLDPIERQVINVPIRFPDDDNSYKFQTAKCTSQHFAQWLCVFYAYKGLLLLFGVYLAWETRRVQIPALNDSRYIGLNIYNVVLSSVTVVSLSEILTDRPTLSYTLISALIVLSTTVLLALLFLPKIYAVLRHGGNATISISDITVEFNTRRFAVDERRETEYRAEVHNRVHKRQLIELEREILRLERLLETAGRHSCSLRSLDSFNGFDGNATSPPVRKRTQDPNRFSIDTETNGKGSQLERYHPSGPLQSLSIRSRYLHLVRKIRLSRFSSAATGVSLPSHPLSASTGAEGFGASPIPLSRPQNNSQFEKTVEVLDAVDQTANKKRPTARGIDFCYDRLSQLHLDRMQTTDDFSRRRFSSNMPHPVPMKNCTGGDSNLALHEATELPQPPHKAVPLQLGERLDTEASYFRSNILRQSSSGNHDFSPKRKRTIEWNKIIREKILKRRLQKVQEELKSQGKPELKISSI